MAMNYTILTGAKTVTGSIRSWQNYDKVDADGVLEDAQAAIYRTLRVAEMRATAALAVSAGASTATLPTGFLDALGMTSVTDNAPMQLLDESDMENIRCYNSGVLDEGTPYAFAVYDGAIQFDCRAKTAFSARLLFHKRPDLLSGGNLTNFLTTKYPDLLRAMCLAFAAEFSHNTEDYQRNYARAMGMMGETAFMNDVSRARQQPWFTTP